MDSERRHLIHSILSLAVDGASPMSVFYPELRMEFEDRNWHSSAHEVVAVIGDMARSGLVRVRELAPDGVWHSVDSGLYDRIAAEYQAGLRRAEIVEQILDQPDIWCEITDHGRRIYEATRR